MNYFFFQDNKIILNPLIIQTAKSGRKFILTGCETDINKTNFKYYYYWYKFKFLDKIEFINELGETYFDNERFSFYFENKKMQYIIKDKRLLIK